MTAVLGYDIDRPWRDLPQADRDWLLFTEEQPVVQVHPKRDRVAKPYKGRFWSARQYTLHTLADSQSEAQRNKAMRFVESGPCQLCGGSGLTRAALAVTFGGLSIARFNALPLTEVAEVLRPAATLTDPAPAQSRVTSGERSEVAKSIAEDLLSRVEVLTGLGLGYLGLDRATPTLSPGEMQRLRIATQLRSGLFGVVYVLDEPSAGLHPADAEPLVRVLEDLRASGNSVFVVEHDMDIVRQADWIVDVAPALAPAAATSCTAVRPRDSPRCPRASPGGFSSRAGRSRRTSSARPSAPSRSGTCRCTTSTTSTSTCPSGS